MLFASSSAPTYEVVRTAELRRIVEMPRRAWAEEEARDILRRVTSEGSAPRNLAAAIRARVAPADRVDLALPAREPMPEPPQFT